MNAIIDLFRSKKSPRLAHADVSAPVVLYSLEKPHTRFPHQHNRAGGNLHPDEMQPKYTQFKHRQERRRATTVPKEESSPNTLLEPVETNEQVPHVSTHESAKVEGPQNSVPIDVLRKALPGRCNVMSPNTSPQQASIHDAFDSDDES